MMDAQERPRPTARPRPWAARSFSVPLRRLCSSLLLIAASVSTEPAPLQAAGASPRQATQPIEGAHGLRFVGSASCTGCHEAEAKRWRGSDHDRGLMKASAEAISGDFGGASFDEGGERFRFSTENGRYFVDRWAPGVGPDDAPDRFEVVYTIGVEPLQQYLVEGPSGRLQALTVAWDVGEQRWFSLQQGTPPPIGDAMHWEGRYYSWNTMCADCHGTRVDRGYDADSDAYATTWAEIDVACESCHGPGSLHVERAKARAAGREGAPAYAKDEFAFDAGGASSREQVDDCGRCHSRRRTISSRWVHGEPLLDHYVPSTLDEGLYFADGQIDDEVYVYGSFTQSRMYAAGVRCTDCHDPHSLAPVAEGNALCTGCHQPGPGRAAFEAARGLYDDSSHHHHTPGEPGSMCVDCHMPARTYMKVDPRRDHKLSVPRPDLSLALGTPNACTGCHEDRAAGWAAEQVRTLWGGPTSRPGDFATAFHDARRGDPSSLPMLGKLAGSPDALPVVRATAVQLAGRFGGPGVEIVERALSDPDPWVRTTAVDSTLAWPPAGRVAPVSPLLADPVRSVRLSAARALAPFEGGGLPPEAQARLAAVLSEVEASLRASGGHPGNRLNLAVLNQGRGDVVAAEAEYRKALEIDPRFIPARLNLVQLLDAQGRGAEVEQLLYEGLATDPGSGEMEYTLGLVLAQQGRLREAVGHLDKAAGLMPDRPRVFYNLGLAHQQLGDATRARAAFEGARRVAPDDVEVLRALAILQAQQGDWASASDYVESLLRVAPQDAAARTLQMRIEQEKSRSMRP